MRGFNSVSLLLITTLVGIISIGTVNQADAFNVKRAQKAVLKIYKGNFSRRLNFYDVLAKLPKDAKNAILTSVPIFLLRQPHLVIAYDTISAMINDTANNTQKQLALNRNAARPILNRHNLYRRQHSAPDLVLDPNINRIAEAYAQKLLLRPNNIQHSNNKLNGQRLGENLAWGTGMTPERCVDMWYNEIKQYNFNNPRFSSNTGHFTQLVWAASRRLGVGYATNPNGFSVCVANYFPAGNFQGRFPQNVRPKKGGQNKRKNINKRRKPQTNVGPITNPSARPNPETNVAPITDTSTSQVILNRHNQYRSQHGAPNLVLDPNINSIAQAYAQKLLSTPNNIQHSGNTLNGQSLGENLAWGTSITPESCVDMWYDEINQYNFNNPGFGGGTGHFTQLVWVASRRLGVGYATNPNGFSVCVANYFPAGNFQGQFPQNVLPKGGVK